MPESRNEKGSPYLVEHNIKSINFEKDINFIKEEIEEKVRRIKKISRNKGTLRELVERDIKRRTFGQIDTDFDVPPAEKIE